MLAAGAQVHAQGSEAGEEMPVIGQAGAAKDGMYMPPPEPEDEQGGHDGEDDDEGDEEYIPHPDDEDVLLKRALEGEDGFNSTLDIEDDGEEEGYHPNYERVDDEEGSEGQDESDGMEAILLAEKAYFIARDHDGDGELSKEEFIRQLKHPDDDEDGTSGWDTWNVSDRGRPAPSDEEMMWGKDWTARVSSEQVGVGVLVRAGCKPGDRAWHTWRQAVRTLRTLAHKLTRMHISATCYHVACYR